MTAAALAHPGHPARGLRRQRAAGHAPRQVLRLGRRRRLRGPGHARRVRAADPVRPGRPRARSSSPSASWIVVGDLSLDLSFRLDPLSALMLSFVTFVGVPDPRLLDRLHAPRGDRRRLRALLRVPEPLPLRDARRWSWPRASSLMFVGWEGVGLCSYLLVGYYFDREYAAAGRQARPSSSTGSATTASCSACSASSRRSARSTTPRSSGKAAEPAGPVHARRWRLICLCLFVGAMGKSAQVPLYVWLPDAMAGPTPVSALIHAATMVTAGVYMVARCNVLFRLAPEVMLFVAVDRLLHRALRRHDRASRRTT